MAEIENHFTVFIRLPFNRGDFVDPPPVSWSAAKERALWDVISRQTKGNDIDWNQLAEDLDVTTAFLLQQAAWLYERQLSQVRAQMRKVGARQSATPSPAPGSVSGSMIGGQAMKRTGSGGSRVPSRMSTQARDSPISTGDGSNPGTPARAKPPLPFRAPSGLLGSQIRGAPPAISPIITQQPAKEAHTPIYGRSRRGSTQHQLSRSPAQGRFAAADSSDSDKEVSASRLTYRRPNPSATSRRPNPNRRDPGARRASLVSNEDVDNADEDSDDDEEDSPLFLPFAATSGADLTRKSQSPTTTSNHHQDPSATLRGGFINPVSHQEQHPGLHRRSTSERLPSSSTRLHPYQQQTQQQAVTQPSHQHHHNNPALSPPPLRGQAGPRSGSDTSPSMGSSFSDLDSASVTQSALEEALLSNMDTTINAAAQHGGNGMASTTANSGAGGGVASRVSGISQALRSRYFDAQGG